jgi:hypothetical protein
MNKVDELLEGMGITRKDLRYTFRWKGRKYYIPTFNPLWWLVTIVAIVGACILMYAMVVMLILIVPKL